ncbi:MAG: translocation/assembly module TamB domain-containing protein [Chromatiaceae bacterium]|nr:translocation/assembly module TamB domain-containing protein [Chromatiaceae bacterium]
MRRLVRLLLILTSLPLLLVAALWGAANTGPGRDFIARQIGPLSSGLVQVEGLAGQLPLNPRLARLEIRDAEGVWLLVEEVALDLNPWPLWRGQIQVEALTATTLALDRLPAYAESTETSTPFQPPPLALRHLAVQRLTLGQVAPGAPAMSVTGQGTLTRLDDFSAQVALEIPGRADRYQVALTASPADLRLDLQIHEDPAGLISALLRAQGVRLPPEVDRWQLAAKGTGPWTALALTADLAAGPLQATAAGQLDLQTQSAANLKLRAELPTMSLALPDGATMAWQAIHLEADLNGPWSAPQGQAQLEATGLDYGESGLSRLTAHLEGDAQGVRLEGQAKGARIPKAPPEFAEQPLRLTAELAPREPGQPFRLDLDHPIAQFSSQGKLEELSGQATLTLADLTTLAILTGQDLAGKVQVVADFALGEAAGRSPRLAASGEVHLTRAPGPTLGLLGPEARLAVTAAPVNGTWQLASARIDGAKLQVLATGCAAEESGAEGSGPDAPPLAPPSDCAAGPHQALHWSLDLPDLTALASDWTGRFQAEGTFAGWPPPSHADAATPAASDLSANLTLDARHAQLGAAKVTGQLAANLSEASGDLSLGGDWGGQPLALRLLADRAANGALNLTLDGSHLAGITASGQMHLPTGATLPQGELKLEASRLADLGPLLGQELAGSLDLRLNLTATQANLTATGKGLRLPSAIGIGQVSLEGKVADLPALAGIEARLQVDGLTAPEVAGDLTLTAKGQQSALDLTATSRLTTSPLGAASLGLAAGLDIPGHRLSLTKLETQANGETLRLLAPAAVDFKDGLAVDHLRLGLGTGTLDLRGRLLPELDLEASLVKLPLERIAALAGRPVAAGLLDAQVKLKGQPDAPAGSLSLKGSSLRLTEDNGFGMPPAGLDTNLTLKPGANALDVSAQMGPKGNLRLRGQVGGTLPLAPGVLALRADGHIDLGLLDPLLTPAGRQATGQANLDARIAGTLAAPKLEGRLGLAGVAYRDWNSGLNLTHIAGNLILDGDRLHLEGLSGQAGSGTLTISGDIGLLAPGLPLNLSLVARNAEPIRFDWLKLRGDADLSLKGPAAGATLAGKIHFDRIDIRLPERVAASVPILTVREEGVSRQPRAQPPQAATPAVPFQMGLELSLAAPRGVYIRGKGVDAELGGELQVGGNLDQPAIAGGFNLIRGEYILVGQTLKFSRGRIGLDGAAGLDPTLDLEARVTAAGSTAILGVKGTATEPRIVLSGEPELPQDEILSRLLFGVAGTRLSPWQTAQVGLAAARLAGLGPKGPGLLESARTTLGLDRLSVGTDKDGGTTAEAGRQLSERVYLGARQGTRAGETQGVLRIELTPSLRLETDIGASSSSRAGIAYEREY